MPQPNAASRSAGVMAERAYSDVPSDSSSRAPRGAPRTPPRRAGCRSRPGARPAARARAPGARQVRRARSRAPAPPRRPPRPARWSRATARTGSRRPRRDRRRAARSCRRDRRRRAGGSPQRPVSTSGGSNACAASAASATRSTASPTSSMRPSTGFQSSIEQPAAPASPSSRTVSATPPESSGKQRSLSTFNGSSVACGDLPDVRDELVPRDAAVQPAERPREARARRSERLGADRRRGASPSPTSHGFGITKIPSRAWSSAKRARRSADMAPSRPTETSS